MARNASWHIASATNASSKYHHDCTAKEPMCQSVLASIVMMGVEQLGKQLYECCISIDKEEDFSEQFSHMHCDLFLKALL